MGKFRWITLVSQDDQDGTELYLNRMNILPPRSIKEDILRRLPSNNVWRCRYSKRVQTINGKRRELYYGTDKMGQVTIAVFDDTCGNLIQIVQK